MNRRQATALLFGGLPGLFVGRIGASQAGERWLPTPALPDVWLVDQTDRRVAVRSLLRQGPVAVSFMFTGCSTVCPPQTALLRAALRAMERDSQLRAVRAISFTVTPENEMTQGHGFPITGRVLSAGGQPSFGVDIESLVSSDMFTVARMALACQRALDNDLSRRQTGAIPETCSVSTRDALRWITLEGARMLGLADRIGSLTPGKQADIVMLRADDWNMWPVHDPCSTVIMQASTGNVEAVMIAGRFRKRDGRLDWPDAERVKRELAQSGRRIVAELGIPTQLRTAAA